jgi:pyruvate,water dikinase
VDLVLGGPALRDPGVVGHKFARQAVLRANGFPVPEFFSVPVAAFDTVRARAELSVSGNGAAVDRGAGLRAAITRDGVPAALAQDILRAFDQLVGPGGRAAVRACAVADSEQDGEDGAADPFAGLSDSFLYVRREDVVDRVADCWASAFTERATHYRERRGLDPGSSRIAVGVQRMIDGRRSFVAFTRDPRDGTDRRVVAAAYGIGEGVVQELADIDHFFVDPRGGTIEAAVVTKEKMVALAPESGPRLLPVPAELAGRPVLTDEEVRRVCALADRVERHFGVPQDIEGTVTADGELHLVQARPIVLAGTAPAEIIWTNHNLTESFPGITRALTFSQASEFYELAFIDFYRRMGVPRRVLDRQARDLRRMIGRIDGRMYYQLDAWYILHSRLPGFGVLLPSWQRVLGLSGAELADAPPVRQSRAALARTLPRALVSVATHPLAVRRFLRWWDRFAEETGRLDGLDARELVASYHRMWSEFGSRWSVTLLNGYFLLACLTLVEHAIARWAPGAGPDLLPALLSGGRENRSLAALRSGLAVAALMRRDPVLRQELRDGDDQKTYQEIAAGRFGTTLAEALREHLARYGDRTVHDLKLEVRTPRQDPWRVLSLLRPLAEREMSVADSRAGERRARRAAAARLRAGCAGPVRRTGLRIALAALRWLIRAREDSRFCRSQLYGLTRDIMWRLGETLVGAGQLDTAEDVTHLTVHEVVGAVDGTLGDGDLRGLAAVRRAELDAAARRAPPPPYLRAPHGRVPPGAGGTVTNGAPDDGDPRALADVRHSMPDVAAGPVLPHEPGTAATGTVLRGLASSSGLVRARARVVLEPDAVTADDCRDRILVARETDPGWLFLMMAAKGIVVERGSLLSHTAITGRLLGIPTVVAVRDAVAGIADGSWIELDGAGGTVRLLSPEESATP